MTLPKAFYEGVIYATAERNPEINDLTKSPTTTEDRYESAKPYIHATKQILIILKNEPESNWDLRSIQQKLEFLPNRELDDSEIQLILNALVDQRYVLEHHYTNEPETPVYYKLPNCLKEKTWTDIMFEALWIAITSYVAFVYYRWKFRYLQRKYGPHSLIPYVI